MEKRDFVDKLDSPSSSGSSSIESRPLDEKESILESFAHLSLSQDPIISSHSSNVFESCCNESGQSTNTMNAYEEVQENSSEQEMKTCSEFFADNTNNLYATNNAFNQANSIILYRRTTSSSPNHQVTSRIQNLGKTSRSSNHQTRTRNPSQRATSRGPCRRVTWRNPCCRTTWRAPHSRAVSRVSGHQAISKDACCSNTSRDPSTRTPSMDHVHQRVPVNSGHQVITDLQHYPPITTPIRTSCVSTYLPYYLEVPVPCFKKLLMPCCCPSSGPCSRCSSGPCCRSSTDPCCRSSSGPCCRSSSGPCCRSSSGPCCRSSSGPCCHNSSIATNYMEKAGLFSHQIGVPNFQPIIPRNGAFMAQNSSRIYNLIPRAYHISESKRNPRRGVVSFPRRQRGRYPLNRGCRTLNVTRTSSDSLFLEDSDENSNELNKNQLPRCPRESNVSNNVQVPNEESLVLSDSKGDIDDNIDEHSHEHEHFIFHIGESKIGSDDESSKTSENSSDLSHISDFNIYSYVHFSLSDIPIASSYSNDKINICELSDENNEEIGEFEFLYSKSNSDTSIDSEYDSSNYLNVDNSGSNETNNDNKSDEIRFEFL